MLAVVAAMFAAGWVAVVLGLVCKAAGKDTAAVSRLPGLDANSTSTAAATGGVDAAVGAGCAALVVLLLVVLLLVVPVLVVLLPVDPLTAGWANK